MGWLPISIVSLRKANDTQSPWLYTQLMRTIGRMSRSHAKLPSLRSTFASNVRVARIHEGMSQEKLALACGLDRTFVGSLEQGIRNISIDNIELIARALRISAHEMLDPALAANRGFDPTVTRAPRSASSVAIKRQPKRGVIAKS